MRNGINSSVKDRGDRAGLWSRPAGIIGRAIDRLEEILMVFLLAGAALLTVIQVFFRYVLGMGFSWSEELIVVFTIWLTLIGASYAVRTKLHIGVDVFVLKMPRRVRRVVQGTVLVLCGGFSGIMAVLAFRFLVLIHASGQQSIPLGVPQWVPYSGLLIGLLLLTARSAQVWWRFVRGEELAAPSGSEEHAV